MVRHLLLLATVAIGGCSVAGAPATTHLGISKQAMVNGTVSSSSQNSVVFVMKGEDESCSGTFIAPNLILTARHCVATPNSSDTTECVGYGPTVDPSTMTIKLGVDAGWDVGDVAATATRIFVPETTNMCSFDVALLLLDQDVPGAKIAPVRFTPLTNGEPVVAVGYGVDGDNNNLPKRMQRSTTILGVGPAAISYQEQDGTTFDYTAPEGDVVTGESTCFGDSGGPLFDAKGAIVAMTSRGPFRGPTGGEHGSTGCIDMVSVYSGALKNEDTIRKAAIAAGHPLPAADTKTTTKSTSDTTGDDDDSTSTASTTSKKKASSTGDDDDDDSSRSRTAAIANAGCNAAPGAPGGGSALTILGAAFAISSSRRRRTASPRSRGARYRT